MSLMFWVVWASLKTFTQSALGMYLEQWMVWRSFWTYFLSNSLLEVNAIFLLLHESVSVTTLFGFIFRCNAWFLLPPFNSKPAPAYTTLFFSILPCYIHLSVLFEFHGHGDTLHDCSHTKFLIKFLKTIIQQYSGENQSKTHSTTSELCI